ncbi:hypothetical protein [Dyella sp.]|uniref:hypothetical protein n=1 Tax=Dyella sp. TaxID=1869338 RepID=UPI002ED28582
MPQAQIIKQTAEEAELASLDPAGDGATHIGRYAIIPDGGDARAPGAAMASPMGNADGLVAARNEKNGAIVLVPPRLKVFGITPAKAQALARQTGGKVTLASNRSRSAYVLFSDLEAARAAIGVFSADPTVEEVSFDVIGELNRPQ